MTRVPKLIVFDLDYTLWPFWVDTHVDPPFTKKRDAVYDSRGKLVQHYPESTKVLEHLKSTGYELAIASRTSEIDGALQLLELFGWSEYFKYKEIYPGTKTRHFENFKQSAQVDFKDMLFFDDEHRNIRDISKMGSCAILVEDGMTLKVLEAGLKTFSRL